MKTFGKLLLITILLISFGDCLAQYRKHDSRTKKFGYTDGRGTWLIEPQFNSALHFRNKTAVVKIDSLYGLIDTAGNYLIDLAYTSIENRDSGFVIIEKHGKFGLATPNGKILISPRYLEIRKFSRNDFLSYKWGDKWGIISINGRVLTGSIFPTESYFYYNKSLKNLVAFKEKRKWGIYDLNGHIIHTPPVYTDIDELHNNLYDITLNDKHGLLDENLNIIQDFNIDQISNSAPRQFPTKPEEAFKTYGVLILHKEDSFALIDTSGTIIRNTWFGKHPSLFDENRYIYYEAGKYGIYDPFGSTDTEPIYEELSYHENFFIYKLEGLWGLLDDNTKRITDPVYKAADYGYGENGIIIMTQENELKSYSLKHKREIELEFDYDNMGALNGHKAARLKINGHYGYFNSMFQQLLAPEYKYIPEILDEEFILAQNRAGNYGVMSTTFETLIEFEYDTLINISSQAFWIIKDGKWGVANIDGTITVPCEYDFPFFVSKYERIYEACDFEFSNPFLMQDTLGTLTLFDIRKGQISPPGAKVLGSSYLLDASHYIQLENGLYTFINDSGKQVFPAISNTLPRKVGNQRLLISKGNEWGLCYLSGEMCADFGAITPAQTRNMMLFLNETQQIDNAVHESDVDDWILYKFILMQQQATEENALRILSSGHFYDKYNDSYRQSHNNACIQYLDASFVNEEPDYGYAPWYGSFTETHLSLGHVAPNLIKSVQNEEYSGNHHGEATFINYFQLVDSNLVGINPIDLFLKSDKLWSFLSAKTLAAIKDEDIDSDGSNLNKKFIINEESTIELHSESITCWVETKYDGLSPIVTIPLIELLEFIPEQGILRDMIKNLQP